MTAASKTQLEIVAEQPPQALQPVAPQQGAMMNIPSTGPLMPITSMESVLNEYAARRKAFRDWLINQLTVGVHYGFTPGTRPNLDSDGNILSYNWKKRENTTIAKDEWRARYGLYKAGAQFLCELMMMRPVFTYDQQITDAFNKGLKPVEQEEQDGGKKGKAQGPTIAFKCELINLGSPFFPIRQPGEVLGEGRGAFNVNEKGMNENSAIKMAEKRALVDAVIMTLGISDLFTQDMEDEVKRRAAANPKTDKAADAPHAQTRTERAAKADDKTAKPSAALFRQWCAKNPGVTDKNERAAQFGAWVKKNLPSIGRATVPTESDPLTAADCDNLSIRLSEEAGQ